MALLLAEDRGMTVGDDPDLMDAYGWLDVPTEAAYSRARIAAVVKAADARAPVASTRTWRSPRVGSRCPRK